MYFWLPLEHNWAIILISMVLSSAFINLSLGVFNLLPFPPLDGSKILAYFLKGKAREFLWVLERYSFIILAFLFLTELPAMIISPVVEWFAGSMLFIVEKILILFI